jgi:hypothetical protein
MQLTGGGFFFRAMSLSVNHHSAGSADPFPAIVVKGNGIVSFFYESFVKNVDHFQKRHVGVNILDLVNDKFSGALGVFLPPYL